MIQAKNFKGGTEVVERINEEVSRLALVQQDVINTLASDVFAGIEAYRDFVETGMRWFDDEEKLFKKNSDLIKSALEKYRREVRRMQHIIRQSVRYMSLKTAESCNEQTRTASWGMHPYAETHR